VFISLSPFEMDSFLNSTMVHPSNKAALQPTRSA
jgi:hypothetical protein